LASLRELDAAFPENAQTSATPARYGEKLAYFLRDYAATLKDWKAEQAAGTSYSDLFAGAWAQCRSFVLPMNPQRTELEFAVGRALVWIGVSTAGGRRRRRR
jgi:poly(A) polymerase